MSDNLTISNMSGGDTLGADDISSVKYQRIKLIFGPDGTNTGDVSAALPLPVSAYINSSTMQDGTTQLTPLFAVISGATSGDNTLVSAVTGKKIRVLSLFMCVAADTTCRFESGASGTALSGQFDLEEDKPLVLPFNPVGWFETAAGSLLNLELGGANQASGSLTYVTV